MALKLNVNRKQTIDVICRFDSSIGSPENYDAYLESFGEQNGPHESLLNLAAGDQPTTFVLRRTIPFELKQDIRTQNFKVRNKDVEMSVNFTTDLIRAALIDVKNPGDDVLRLKRGKDGLVNGEYINMLEEASVLGDLVKAYQNATVKSEQERADGKKS